MTRNVGPWALLVAAVALGTLLRVVQLDSIPGINGDDAWYGVNVNELLIVAIFTADWRQSLVCSATRRMCAVYSTAADPRRAILNDVSRPLDRLLPFVHPFAWSSVN